MHRLERSQLIPRPIDEVFAFSDDIFDAFDGRVARATKTQSAFGTQLDSLADAIAFGVAQFFAVGKSERKPVDKPKRQHGDAQRVTVDLAQYESERVAVGKSECEPVDKPFGKPLGGTLLGGGRRSFAEDSETRRMPAQHREAERGIKRRARKPQPQAGRALLQRRGRWDRDGRVQRPEVLLADDVRRGAEDLP